MVDASGASRYARFGMERLHRVGEVVLRADIAGEDDERHIRPAVRIHRAPDGHTGNERAEHRCVADTERFRRHVAGGDAPLGDEPARLPRQVPAQ